MGTGAEDWQAEMARWFATLQQAWGLGAGDDLPPLERLWEHCSDPAIATPEAARTSAAGLHQWQAALPSAPPAPPDWETGLAFLGPLARFVAPAGTAGFGPGGSLQRQLTALASNLHDWQRAALTLAGTLAGIVATGTEDYAAAIEHTSEPDAETRLARWATCVEVRYERALAEGGLAEALAAFWSAATATRNALTAVMDEIAPSLGLPSRAELANAQERITRLERQLAGSGTG
ncbi:hypothetical protein KBTX_01218 [wastewater metagenome]|uniref:Poly(3-hydroxyalkanoate) polymerase subunit PhaE n=2 Tax=unclassified sequences TaxID=12908 RepID=A0A5B8R883_9ZZZZ|nr:MULTISPECIES: poly(R)-hydroxyalkanoic acid synthase subunit PhaE [Arhodomonas]MCS4504186.1 hypothetical protein [Arhodomonas aquaeolei]QEA04900.1 hypothetical protein KBTEX_01218 [uncultured organism]